MPKKVIPMVPLITLLDKSFKILGFVFVKTLLSFRHLKVFLVPPLFFVPD